jgi:hypothetical protein
LPQESGQAGGQWCTALCHGRGRIGGQLKEKRRKTNTFNYGPVQKQSTIVQAVKSTGKNEHRKDEMQPSFCASVLATLCGQVHSSKADMVSNRKAQYGMGTVQMANLSQRAYARHRVELAAIQMAARQASSKSHHRPLLGR